MSGQRRGLPSAAQGAQGTQGQAIAPPSRADFDFPDDPFEQPQHGEASSSSTAQHRKPESLTDWAKNTRFTVLNHFSQVTNVARNGAHTLMSSPLFRPPSPEDLKQGRGRGGGRSAGAAVGTSLQQHGPVGPFGPSDPDWKHSELARKSGTSDFDSAHVYLARWARIVAEEGEKSRQREQEVCKSSPLDASRRRSTSSKGETGLPMEQSDVGAFEVWDRTPWTDRPASTRLTNHPLTQAEWDMCFYADGTPVLSWSDVKAKIFERGFSAEEGCSDDVAEKGALHWDQMSARAEAWSFLLGAQCWSQQSSKQARRLAWKRKTEEYWLAKGSWSRAFHDHRHAAEAGKGAVAEDYSTYLKDECHRIRVDCLRVDKKLPFFSQSRDAVHTGADHPSDNAHIRRLEMILLTYVAWNHEQEEKTAKTSTKDEDQGLGGYVQGMSDLCAPLYVLCGGDEPKTFWLLVGLMERVRHNFYKDQSGMKMQLLALQRLIIVLDPGLHAHLERLDALNLFFCFRWLLVCFKREFEYPDIMRLWEAIWAAALDPVDAEWKEENTEATKNAAVDPLTLVDDAKPDAGQTHARSNTSLSDHFQIFVALAVLEQQRDIVVKYLHHFDEILQYMNGLSGQLDVDSTLAEAQVACLSLRNLIALQRGESSEISADGKESSQTAADGTRVQRRQAAAALPPVDRELCALVGEREP